MILGDFDLYELIAIRSVMGPVFVFTYIFFVYFVLLNMFLAIINDAYSRIESDLTKLQPWRIRTPSINFLLCLFPPIRNECCLSSKSEVEPPVLHEPVTNDTRSVSEIQDIQMKLTYDDYFTLDQYVNQLEQRITMLMSRVEKTLLYLDNMS